MKKPGLLAIVLAAILYTAPLSLHWIVAREVFPKR